MGLLDDIFKALGGALSGNSLESAAQNAPREPGVYKLYLDGRLMKVGKAEWGGGIRWRMQQYWRGDSTSGLHGHAIYANRERVKVSWTLCPADRCREIEIEQQDAAGGVDNLPWCERS